MQTTTQTTGGYRVTLGKTDGNDVELFYAGAGDARIMFDLAARDASNNAAMLHEILDGGVVVRLDGWTEENRPTVVPVCTEEQGEWFTVTVTEHSGKVTTSRLLDVTVEGARRLAVRFLGYSRTSECAKVQAKRAA